MSILVGSYRPGTTLLHRIPAGPKLGLLAGYGVVSVVVSGWESALCLIAFSLGLVLWAQMPVGAVLRGLRPLLIACVVLGGFQVWQRGWPTAVHVVGDLIAVVMAAIVFTATTPVDSMLDAITRGLHPVRRLIDPERVGLAFALMIRAIPGIAELARESRDAARARGLDRNLRAVMVPTVLRTVQRAYETGDALAARGIGDD